MAVLVGLVVLAMLAGLRVTFVHALPPVVGALVAFGAMIPYIPTTESSRPGLAAVGLALGVSLAIGLARLASRQPRLAVGLTALVTTALVATAIAVAGPALRTIAATRLNVASFGREGAARAAFGMVADHPLLGVGPGQARFMWSDASGRAVAARYAHNEYLQLLVEMGVIGLALLLVLLVALILIIRSGRVRSGAALWAGAAAGFAVLVVHSAFDFLWQLPICR